MNYLPANRIDMQLARRSFRFRTQPAHYRVGNGAEPNVYRWAAVEYQLVRECGLALPDAQAFLMDCFLAGATENTWASTEEEVSREAA